MSLVRFNTQITKERAVVELILSGFLWGFAFVAVKWALGVFSPIMTLVLRFSLAFITGELIRRMTLKNDSIFSRVNRKHFSLSFPAGFWLAFFLILQTFGLKFTTATNSGFITILYVIFVPLISHFFYKKYSNYITYFCVALALLGAYLLMGADVKNINQGDWLTLGCSLVAAFQIIYIDQVSEKISSPIKFNNLQSFWAFVIILPFLFFEPKESWINFSTSPNELQLAIFGIIALVASSVIAFLCQVRSQTVLNSTTASLLFLLESPYAMLVGILFLNEKISFNQGLGASIILSAAILAILAETSFLDLIKKKQ